MPRLSTVRVEALRELVDQLRFSAPAAAIKHIERAESLAIELDPTENYPLEWVLFRLTDYRSSEIEGLVTGSALLSDLSAMVERLCAYAKLTAEAIPEHLMLGELCTRWQVSTKTIARWRRQGLVARRITTPGTSTVQLVFTKAMIEHFEQTHPDKINTAGRFTRLSDKDQLRLILRIERYQHSLGWSRSRAIDRVAQRTGRSRETLRLLMVNDQPDPAQNTQSDHDLFEAWRSGESLSTIGTRSSLSASTVQSRLLAVRTRKLVNLLPRLSPTPDQRDHLHNPDSLLEPEAVRRGLISSGTTRLTDLIVQMNQRVVPVGAHERLLGCAIVALRARAASALNPLDGSTPRASVLDAIETDLRWASRLKATLASPMLCVCGAQMNEVIGSAGERMPTSEWLSLIQTVLEAMSSGLDRWDPWSRGRPAGAVSLAVGRATTRWLGDHPQSHRKTSAARIIQPDATIEDWTRTLDPWQRWLEGPAASHDPLVEARFGLAGEAPVTAAQLAASRGTTPAAIERSVRRTLLRTPRTQRIGEL